MRYNHATAEQIESFRSRKKDPGTTYFEFLSLHTKFRRLVEDALTQPQDAHTKITSGSDLDYVCARCGTVAFFNIAPECLREWGYDEKSSISQLTLIVKLNSIGDDESAVLRDCPFCSWGPMPMNEEPHKRWLPLQFKRPDFVPSLFHKLATSDRYTQWMQSRSMQYEQVLSVFALLSGSSGPFVPQRVPSLYNPARIRLWLKHCEQHHGSRCNEGVLGMHGMRLIDCVEMKVVEADPCWKWVALSYVWGMYDVQRLGWSRTVLDAAKVTQEIGYRYLWVDKHCIGQSESSHKEEQIRNMHKIYQGADITIVAASGDSMHHGIHGVSLNRRMTNWESHFGDAVAYIHTTSPWWKRAWT